MKDHRHGTHEMRFLRQVEFVNKEMQIVMFVHDPTRRLAAGKYAPGALLRSHTTKNTM